MICTVLVCHKYSASDTNKLEAKYTQIIMIPVNSILFFWGDVEVCMNHNRLAIVYALLFCPILSFDGLNPSKTLV